MAPAALPEPGKDCLQAVRRGGRIATPCGGKEGSGPGRSGPPATFLPQQFSEGTRRAAAVR